MKTLWIAGVMLSVAAAAQTETDDLYFRSKDRAALTSARTEEWNKTRTSAREASEVVTKINPTDSYSGRNVNPEYNSQVKVDPSAAQQSAYFTPDYAPTAINQNLVNNSNAWNSNFNSLNNSPWGFSPMMGFNSGFGSPWGMGWNDPWMMNGWNNGMGMGFGNCFSCMNSWNSPWGMNGWGSPWGMNNGWNMSLGFGWGMMNSWNSPWGWNNWGWNSGWGGGWGRPVIIVNNNIDSNNPIVYGRRPGRSSVTNQVIDNSRPVATYTSGGRQVNGGRTRSESTQYYDRSWRQSSGAQTNNRGYWNNTGSGSNTRSSWGSDRSDWSNSSGRSWSNDSRSSSYGGYNSGGGSRSGSSSGGSSGGGRRGRN